MSRHTALTRRGLLAAGGAVILGAASGCTSSREPTAVATAAPTPAPSVPPALPASYPFYGAHQAGIETPPALRQTFIGLDLKEPSAQSADAVLRLVSDDAARLTQGQPALGDTEPEIAANPAGLTITVGLGRSLFDRTASSSLIPAALVEIPRFRTDAFEKPWEQTDLLLQVGSDDDLTLSHAVRMLTKDLSTLTDVRWVQRGFRPAAPANPGTTTTRNLMGQVDGTINPAPQTQEFDDVVWVKDDGSRWANGGTVLVLRRIRMLLDTWDILDRQTQENVIGRRIDSGAPLGGTSETDPVDFDAVDDKGLPVIPTDAHIRVAHATTTREMILRRPYSYDDGMRNGTNDMGLLFAAYMSDPATSFIPMQKRVAELDAFNRWNTTIGSAAYFLPAGAAEGGYVGEGIFT